MPGFQLHKKRREREESPVLKNSENCGWRRAKKMYNLILKIKSCSYGGYSIVLIGKQLPGCGKEKTSSEGAKCNLVIPPRHEQTLSSDVWKSDFTRNLWVEGGTRVCLYFEDAEHCPTIPGLDVNIFILVRGGEERAVRC